MQYLGGKARSAKWIGEFLRQHWQPGMYYLEPFCGACWVTVEMATLDCRRDASDAHPDLIMLWRALQEGWMPPTEITETEYKQIMASLEPSALRGFVGFGCSWGGKWRGGYARSGPRNYAANARNSLLAKLEQLRTVRFQWCDYREHEPHHRLIYCDPPYQGTTSYKEHAFDHADFWATMRQWSADNAVYISEYQAPVDFVAVAQQPRLQNMRQGGERCVVVEKLWTHKDCKAAENAVSDLTEAAETTNNEHAGESAREHVEEIV